ncbi:hypothetical protein [Lactiplantibacillus pentosus]|uniref:Uncharacterized protein n=1 Tax=Lactiplantibacillus pentosus TaxID=1589 RepID=A0AB37RL86_LACPE|nr:hypothetical protein [Lactiplantibacillus pentosus]RMW49941.1 hypothetical protein D6U20_00195 [Lactiplantibacillus pentosus]RMW50478.1 hypothetical protein D6U19_00075 [Lactiplantibacillus pentosus]RMW57305.1 hypothetical protein D6U17_00795 [Lactiplantibacillus pentosus]RMW57671.1 hypothetical protein D6U21_00700 [Lactiplantibacillus pentosus]
MTTKYPPLITKADIDAIHKGNEINRQILRAGLKELANEVHKGNEQSSRVIRKVADKWIN